MAWLVTAVMAMSLSVGDLAAAPAAEVWIAVRTDGKAGQGTLSDPYDGSSQEKFDALVASFGPNTHMHLGRGTYQTAWDHSWVVKDGWSIEGAGMKTTVIQLVPGLTKQDKVSAAVFAGVYDKTVTGFVVKNLTIDCNWAGLANSAQPGKPVRSFAASAAVSDSATIFAEGGFTQMDVGRTVSGSGIPENSWIGIVKSPTSIGLSSSAVSNKPVKASLAKGTTIVIAERNCQLMAAYVYGANNCTFDHVRAIHGYGSITNGVECFALGFASGPTHEATGNLMTNCLVEEWHGNYASPFALAGFRGSPSYPGVVTAMTNSRVEYCSAIGKPGIVGYPDRGSVTPFTSGGVNLADVKNCVVRNNRFVDCQGAAYQDTGGFDGVEVSGNTVIRGFEGVVFSVTPGNFPDAVFRNLKILRNRLGIQRRFTKGANYGILVRNNCAPRIEGNYITYDKSGPGGDVFWGLSVSGTGGTIIHNTIDGAEFTKVGDNGVTNGAPDSRFQLSNNRTPRGGSVRGMADARSK